MIRREPRAREPSARSAAGFLTARSWTERSAWTAVLAYLLLVPATGVWVRVSGHDYARVMELVVCLVCAIAVAARGWAGPATRRIDGVAGALLVIATASTLHAPDLRMAARELTLAIGLAGVVGLMAGRKSDADLTTLLATVSLAGASYAALAGLGLAVNLAVADTLRPFDLLIGYDNGRFFNHVQTSMLPLLVLATLHPCRARWVARAAWFGLSAGIALLALSEGRATGLALGVGGVVGLALFGRTAWPVVRHFAIASAGAALLYAVVFVALPRLAGLPVQALHVEGITDSGSAQSRWVLWEIALQGIRRSPWLGIGPMHFSHTWNADAAHPHNVYLQVAEEWGVPMLFLLLGIVLSGMRRLYRAVGECHEPAERTVGTVLFVTAVAIAVDGLLSGNFVMPVSQMWIAVVLGAAVGWVRRPARKPVDDPAGPARLAWRRALGFLPLMALLWLCASVRIELGEHFLDRRAPGATSDAGAPRFWSNGWF